MTASAFRWAIIDTLHHWTGLPRPLWDDARLQSHLEAFHTIVEHHYRYYQFYANSVIAITFTYTIWLITTEPSGSGAAAVHMATIAVELVFLAMSRDALRKYYARTARLLGILDRAEGVHVMGNGSHPPKPSKPQPPKPQTKEAPKPQKSK